ncbi:hypothetical protein SXIM_01820 [Streptomyces xiamenensis]|uniref:Uncharacterized protein n=1 Tax=Streptomyces xiamenensis TaxID=408015 RepID=A0A0F7CMQ4_9ACTN|nr:hypothetical protein SXIM_01820 [Streptomyces xiamenensis]
MLPHSPPKENTVPLPEKHRPIWATYREHQTAPPEDTKRRAELLARAEDLAEDIDPTNPDRS